MNHEKLMILLLNRSYRKDYIYMCAHFMLCGFVWENCSLEYFSGFENVWATTNCDFYSQRLSFIWNISLNQLRRTESIPYLSGLLNSRFPGGSEKSPGKGPRVEGPTDNRDTRIRSLNFCFFFDIPIPVQKKSRKIAGTSWEAHLSEKRQNYYSEYTDLLSVDWIN